MTNKRTQRNPAVSPVIMCGLRKKRKDKEQEKLVYACEQHKNLPHVVKFSGGRSSGMLLFTLLDNKMLQAERGDVVVFNNTSAEHPATYEFVRQCKIECEKAGIPFFWTEFQTYEDASAGIYNRLPAYRLVNHEPFSEDNPNGYHWRGEVFEELVSWHGFLPNKFKSRTCTKMMKLGVSNEFLRDWFACKEGIARLGHYGETSKINPDEVYAFHLKNRGSVPKDIFIRKKEFCWSRPLYRAEARFADFSQVADYTKIDNPELNNKNLGGRVLFDGDFAVEYCSFVGFRADEPQRIAKMRARQNTDNQDDTVSDTDSFYLKTPEGEHIYAPLVQLGTSKDSVVNFWREREWDLKLPSTVNRSNCVYCFLKGENALWQLAHRQEAENKKMPKKIKAQANTPSDIEWWAQLEEKYGRDLIAEKRQNNNKSFIGFFGTDKMSYREVQKLSNKFKDKKLRGKKRNIYLSEFQSLPCDCTD